ncbi:hypothetical protein NDU88_004603 [Pleurodeles waltl]|uniref:Uncharacterized protein n=1 Tax=Pleurodeles waltl TaxID=8319 RepID=A0AAV7RHU1_PLEWA|nr:hypothetical protein NDU88_004603 [Pleurodeles waltl]
MPKSSAAVRDRDIDPNEETGPEAQDMCPGTGRNLLLLLPVPGHISCASGPVSYFGSISRSLTAAELFAIGDQRVALNTRVLLVAFLTRISATSHFTCLRMGKYCAVCVTMYYYVSCAMNEFL